MLTKKMTGRLGNQMFQYATMRAIQLKMYPEEDINLDFRSICRDGKKEDGFFNQLSYFTIKTDRLVFNGRVKLSWRQKILVIKYFVERKLIKIFSNKISYEWKKQKYEMSIQKRYNKNGLYFYSYGYYDFQKALTKNKLFIGFYESANFFNGIRDRLLDEFQPKQRPLERNKYLYDIIENSESVCVTIRRGDFVSSRFASSVNVCDEKYFKMGIDYIKKRINNPKFFVFSDDIEWVKKHMNFPSGTMFESGKDPVWEKLRLMYSCKHFIISNSSFSWWAQYLSRNKNKIVIAPARWRRIGYDGSDLYDKSWKIIEG